MSKLAQKGSKAAKNGSKGVKTGQKVPKRANEGVGEGQNGGVCRPWVLGSDFFEKKFPKNGFFGDVCVEKIDCLGKLL